MRIRPLTWLGLSLLAAAGPALAAAGGPAIEIERLEAAGAANAVEGAALRLTLSPELARSWREANVGLIAVRSDGRQSAVDAAAAPGAELDVALPASGCALFVADLGTPGDKGFADSWRRTRRSVKAVVCNDSGDPARDLAARRRAAAVFLARAGTRDEVRPLANPATTRPGADLPLRLYADGHTAAGIEVVAEGPGGAGSVTRSDAHGFATVSLPVAGPWRIHFRPGPDRVAELLFDVPAAAPRRESP